MSEPLREYCHSGSETLRIDPTAAVIRGVKILGLRSRNGRVYSEAALRRAVPLYEGAKVNVNHPRREGDAPRDYQERLGVVRSVAFRAGSGLYGDLHYNPKHPVAEQLVWDAQHQPENVGLSHNVIAQTRREGEQLFVEAVERVISVDLVADPATTAGLFEGQPEPSEATPQRAWLAELDVATLRRERPDLVAALSGSTGDDSHAALQSQRQKLTAEIARLEEQRTSLERRLRVRQLLRQHGLPDPETAVGRERLVVSDAFLEHLLALGDEQAVVRLIEERAAVAALAGLGPRTVCRDQLEVDRLAQPQDAWQFVAAIT